MAMLCVIAVHLVSHTDLLEFLDMGMASVLFVVLTVASTPNMVGQWGSRPARRAPVCQRSPSRDLLNAGVGTGPFIRAEKMVAVGSLVLGVDERSNLAANAPLLVNQWEWIEKKVVMPES